ncbi:hypothetical protein GUJ93_ZPchr0013g36473 [Zizania palustris]|uniref:Uncharacterized protein n=1 Tax=Zizania palustris TaxID=103762 RepID=A0A8J5WY04_ZIZPA|nr:hypothetical protein GUJ93_ZPchr0013g36473 [Zizania palustris]
MAAPGSSSIASEGCARGTLFLPSCLSWPRTSSNTSLTRPPVWGSSMAPLITLITWISRLPSMLMIPLSFFRLTSVTFSSSGASCIPSPSPLVFRLTSLNPPSSLSTYPCTVRNSLLPPLVVRWAPSLFSILAFPWGPQA